MGSGGGEDEKPGNEVVLADLFESNARAAKRESANETIRERLGQWCVCVRNVSPLVDWSYFCNAQAALGTRIGRGGIEKNFPYLSLFFSRAM